MSSPVTFPKTGRLGFSVFKVSQDHWQSPRASLTLACILPLALQFPAAFFPCKLSHAFTNIRIRKLLLVLSFLQKRAGESSLNWVMRPPRQSMSPQPLNSLWGPWVCSKLQLRRHEPGPSPGRGPWHLLTCLPSHVGSPADFMILNARYCALQQGWREENIPFTNASN